MLLRNLGVCCQRVNSLCLLLLFLLKYDGLILINPSLVLHLTFNHMRANNSSDNAADASHIEEEIFTGIAIIEASLVANSDSHVFFAGNVGLIICDLEDVSLVQMNLLIVFRFTEE